MDTKRELMAELLLNNHMEIAFDFMATQSTNIVLRQSKYITTKNSLFISCGSVHLFRAIERRNFVRSVYVFCHSILITMEYFLHDQLNWMNCVVVRVWDDIDRFYMQFFDITIQRFNRNDSKKMNWKFQCNNHDTQTIHLLFSWWWQ